MEVSMAQLFRLMCASLLFGGVLYLFFRTVLLAYRAWSLSAESVSPRLAKYLPKDWECYIRKGKRERYKKCVAFFADFFLALSCGVCFIIFLFWMADGIPRFFVFCAAGGGAYLVKRLTARPFWHTEGMVKAVFTLCLLWGYVPVIRSFCYLLRFFLGFFKKIALFFIKRIKRFYTICTAKKYTERAVKSLGEARILAVLQDAGFGKEEK